MVVYLVLVLATVVWQYVVSHDLVSLLWAVPLLLFGSLLLLSLETERARLWMWESFCIIRKFPGLKICVDKRYRTGVGPLCDVCMFTKQYLETKHGGKLMATRIFLMQQKVDWKHPHRILLGFTRRLPHDRSYIFVDVGLAKPFWRSAEDAHLHPLFLRNVFETLTHEIVHNLFPTLDEQDVQSRAKKELREMMSDIAELRIDVPNQFWIQVADFILNPSKYITESRPQRI